MAALGGFRGEEWRRVAGEREEDFVEHVDFRRVEPLYASSAQESINVEFASIWYERAFFSSRPVVME